MLDTARPTRGATRTGAGGLAQRAGRTAAAARGLRWLALLAVAALPGGWAMEYHVSPAGNDANDGLGPDRAFRTLQAAVDRAVAGDTVLAHAGVYRETVTFEHDGEPDRPITLRPFQDDVVTVSGCDPVNGWEADRDGAWRAPMPWTLGLGRNQVFADDRVLVEARFPNEPGPDLGMYVADLSALWPTFGEFSLPKETLKEQPGRLVSALLKDQPDDYWKGALYYGVHYEGWSAQTGVIESSKSGEITVGDRTRTWWFGPAYGGGYSPEEGRGMIVGHRHALDRPGEWYWQDDVLVLIPFAPGAPQNVEAKRRQLAFDLGGRRHVRVEGLRVTAASLRLADATACTVDRCHVSYASHFTRFYDIGQVENGRDTIRSGETGIFISGRDNAFTNGSVRVSAGAGFYLRGYHHTIHNTLIDEVDYTSHYLNAITDAVSDFGTDEGLLVGGHVITYNTMRNAGRHFFNIHGNGTSTASRTRGPMDYMATLFAHNHLYNGMLQTKDAGFITGYYSSGGTLDGLNTQIVYNAMHDCYDIFGMRINVLGIVYLDAGTCDVDLHHNLLWAAPGSHQRGLWYNTMCVDVREHDNVFHPNFARTVADLQPADFPEGKPFRFGHDFANPPPLPRWPQLDRLTLPLDPASPTLATLRDGDTLPLGTVDLDAGWQSAVLRFASDVKAMNTDRSDRAEPRHHQTTDPLVLEAIHSDAAQERIRSQWTFRFNVEDGAWLRFNQVPLGDGYRRLRLVYGNDQPGDGRRLEVRLDAVDGPAVGQADLPQTDRPRGGRIQIYAQAVAEIDPAATGTRDVFLVLHSADGKPVGEFEYARFEQVRGTLPLRKNEVKLELRAGRADGPLLGTLYPRSTGSASLLRDAVASLEPARGRQPLFLVVHSALDQPFGRIEGVRLEKATQPVDWTGVGLPPLADAQGRLLFPQPTNRPCARPADRYLASRAANRPNRPIAAATRLPAPPTLDGNPADWAAGPGLALAQSWDGTATPTTPSTAWVAYDDEALYVGFRNPVPDPAALARATDHTWGATDAVEVALQDALAAKPGPILNLYGWPDSHLESVTTAGAPTAVAEALGKAVAYRAASTPDAWTCEWRIPFSACGFQPRETPVVWLNLGVRKLRPDGWAIWCGTDGPTYAVAAAGSLAFADALAASPAYPPRQGLAVWLDAAAPGTVEADADGAVAAWKDRSGNGRDALQPTPARRPRLAAAGLNGKPALLFSETTHTRLDLPDLADGKITATVLAVVSNPTPGAEVNHDPRIFTASDGKGFDYQVGLAATVPGMETGGPRQTLHVFTDRWAKSVRVGCFSPNDQTFFTGAIAEILVYARALSPAEREAARAYLKVKWALE